MLVKELQSTGHVEQLNYWESQTNFSKNWDIEAIDFTSMFNASFKSQLSVRLWQKEDWYPKEVMMEFLAIDKEFVRTMFKDLFNDEKDLNMRCSRFILYCDQLIKMLQKSKPQFIEHYHANYEMIFTYLAFRFPEKYTFYNFQNFTKFLQFAESKRIPASHDAEQFRKMTKVFSTLLSKNQSFMSKADHQLEKAGVKNKWLNYWIPFLMQKVS